MKVGLIGAGGWGKNLARTLHELGALGGIAEIRPDLRAELSILYPDVPLYLHHYALLESDLPAVAVATPAATHSALAKEALLAGKHVFVEKPLALATHEAEELVALARKRGRVLMVGHLLLYQPAVRWIKEFLDSGALGEIWSLHQERLNLGRARSVENALWSLGVHDVAVVLYLVGREPGEVRVVGQAALQPNVEDDVYLHLRFPGGIRAHLHASWLWPEKRRRLTVIGEAGMLVYDEVEQTVTFHRKAITPQLTSRDEGAEVVFQGHGEPLKLELAHFLECVAEGKRPLSDGESAVPVVRVLEEATRQLSEAR
ncbi:MAG: Gfo/Idh/MocA family oxidoreductase [Candidatus Acetothermia bacterium]|jgi:predicted dehydrogenase|nr:Gfo/Idh/MocA family oxidoreductase [Candidatus Acetothermia bacterium]